MGVGTAAGREKAEQAAQAAIASPLLETDINGATGVLVNVTGSSEMTLDDVETAAGIVQEAANPDANIIFGATVCDDFQDEMRVTVIATGFDQSAFVSAAPKATVKAVPQKPQAQGQEEEVELKPVSAPADIGEIDEIFKIFGR
jgi:cell division protein FtsZ